MNDDLTLQDALRVRRMAWIRLMLSGRSVRLASLNRMRERGWMNLLDALDRETRAFTQDEGAMFEEERAPVAIAQRARDARRPSRMLERYASFLLRMIDQLDRELVRCEARGGASEHADAICEVRRYAVREANLINLLITETP